MLIRVYTRMVRIRHLELAIEKAYPEDRIRTPVHLCIGQEAVAAGVCTALHENDLVFSNHRGHGHYLAKGGDMKALVAELFGKKTGCAGGRGGSMHLIDKGACLMGSSAIVGGGISLAAGGALSLKMQQKNAVSAVFFGDGAAEQGVLYETINIAVKKKLPVLFVLEDNQYSVCTPKAERRAWKDFSAFSRAFGIHYAFADGNQAYEVYDAAEKAREAILDNTAPFFLECLTYRIPGHAGPGDDLSSGYRSRAEKNAWEKKCPLALCEKALLGEGILSRETIDSIRRQILEEVAEAFSFGENSPFPASHTLMEHVYAEIPPENREIHPPGFSKPPREISHAAALREAISFSMEKDDTVYVMGQGINDASGMFGVTKGLFCKFGTNRVFDTPLSENALTGMAMGSAITGMRPLYCHNRPDFLLLAMDPLVNHAAKWNHMFGGKPEGVPLVVWSCIGRGWAPAAQHSQAIHGLFLHVPGLCIVTPSNACDAKGLMRTCLTRKNPVIFMDHRFLLRKKCHVPEEDYSLPLGVAKVLKKGKDITIAGVSYMIQEAYAAGCILESKGVDAEVIDLRTLRPLDEEAILASVAKTGKLLVVDMGWSCGGVCGEIIAMAAERGGDILRVPPARLASPDCPAPSSMPLEQAFYPDKDAIVRKVLSMMEEKNTG